MLGRRTFSLKVRRLNENKSFFFDKDTAEWSHVSKAIKKAYSLEQLPVIRFELAEDNSSLVFSDGGFQEVLKNCEEPLQSTLVLENYEGSEQNGDFTAEITSEGLLEDFSSSEIMQMLRDIALYIAARDEKEFLVKKTQTKRLITSNCRKNNLEEDAISTEVGQWSESQVSEWLQASGLKFFSSLFLENSINGSALLNIDDATLISMGISQAAKRWKIIKAVAALKIAQTLPSECVSPSLQRLISTQLHS
ncbi:uncharacterized protein LOC135121782 isoform X2 [Zophobas morio]|uniref:uncharacterized protein LOC135121782 isoform X2 n=1 Tax=Zophobas morio TaxID=2755281 RepID=UPI00308388EF